MNKAVLISIRPEWCEKIGSGEKTVEVRKTRPALPTPFKCYIYCTNGKYPHEDFLCFDAGTNKIKAFYGGGKVIGEFICDKIVAVLAHPTIFAGHPMFFEKACKDACLSYDEIETYAGGKDVYGYHITDLVIYDEPKDLRAFHYYEHSGMVRWVSHPPQSWCYVEEL